MVKVSYGIFQNIQLNKKNQQQTKMKNNKKQ